MGKFAGSPKLNTELPYDPATPFLDTYPREIKTYAHTEACMQMFTAAELVKPRGELKNPSTDEWINKVCTCNGILLSHKKEQGADICYNLDEHQKYYTK